MNKNIAPLTVDGSAYLKLDDFGAVTDYSVVMSEDNKTYDFYDDVESVNVEGGIRLMSPKFSYTIGESTFKINGVTYDEMPSIKIDDEWYIPIKFIMDKLNFRVYWVDKLESLIVSVP